MNEIHPTRADSQPAAGPAGLRGARRRCEAEIDELITHYPKKRSASLMLLHAIQEQFGYISRQAVEWIAGKLELQPINIYELVTFYPMFHAKPVGKYHLKVCRTLSCALGGSYKLHEHFCQQAGPGPARARPANHQGRQVHGGVCRVPRRLRHRAGDDVQRCVSRGRHREEGGRDSGGVQMSALHFRTPHSALRNGRLAARHGFEP